MGYIFDKEYNKQYSIRNNHWNTVYDSDKLQIDVDDEDELVRISCFKDYHFISSHIVDSYSGEIMIED